MYASDHAHGESWFPKSVETVMGWNLPSDLKQKLFWDNPLRFYRRYAGVTAEAVVAGVGSPMPFAEATARLQHLLRRRERVLTVMHTPSAGLAKAMDEAGAEAGFVGTAGVVGAYTGMEDVGVASIPECAMIGGWIARAVRFPVILDGDTGHGSIMGVRRLVEDSIETVLARYRAAVDCKRELDPNFVIMAQCYAGEAKNGFGEPTSIAR